MYVLEASDYPYRQSSVCRPGDRDSKVEEAKVVELTLLTAEFRGLRCRFRVYWTRPL
jgi:hypothetical protein